MSSFLLFEGVLWICHKTKQRFFRIKPYSSKPKMQINGAKNFKVCPPGKIGPYVIREEIGTGRTSAVYKAVNMSTNEAVAIKILPKQQFQFQSELSRFQNEVSSIFKCQHPNIVSFINLFHDSLNLYLVMELADTDLQQIISRCGKMPLDQAQATFRQIAEAICYIHSMGIAHRDIKLENILVNSAERRVLLSDFGYSISPRDFDQLSTTKLGTLVYLPPEIVDNKPYNPFKADIWSCGILLYALLTAKFPWPTRNEEEIIQKIRIRKIEFPDNLSPGIINLINSMTDIIPDKRPSFQEILQHPWIRDISVDKNLFTNKYHPNSTFKVISQVFKDCMNQRVIVPRTNKSNFHSVIVNQTDSFRDLLNVLQKSNRKKRLRSRTETSIKPVASFG